MFKRLITLLTDWARRIETESALRDLDDRILADIGLNRRRPLLLAGLEPLVRIVPEPGDVITRPMDLGAPDFHEEPAPPAVEPRPVAARKTPPRYQPNIAKGVSAALAGRRFSIGEDLAGPHPQ